MRLAGRRGATGRRRFDVTCFDPTPVWHLQVREGHGGRGGGENAPAGRGRPRAVAVRATGPDDTSPERERGRTSPRSRSGLVPRHTRTSRPVAPRGRCHVPPPVVAPPAGR